MDYFDGKNEPKSVILGPGNCEIIIQCKNFSKKLIPPSDIRQLSGSHDAQASLGRRKQIIVGLCSTQEMSVQAFEQFNIIASPAFYLRVEPFIYRGTGCKYDAVNYKGSGITDILRNSAFENNGGMEGFIWALNCRLLEEQKLGGSIKDYCNGSY